MNNYSAAIASYLEPCFCCIISYC
uniref:Uncharacterized protein n=1 Tax=Arundo donax TaxID=35708 RepID=A0A0A9A4T1_ARUDO